MEFLSHVDKPRVAAGRNDHPTTSSAQEGQVEELSTPEPPQVQGMQLWGVLLLPGEQRFLQSSSDPCSVPGMDTGAGQPGTERAVPAMAG